MNSVQLFVYLNALNNFNYYFSTLTFETYVHYICDQLLSYLIIYPRDVLMAAGTGHLMGNS